MALYYIASPLEDNLFDFRSFGVQKITTLKVDSSFSILCLLLSTSKMSMAMHFQDPFLLPETEVFLVDKTTITKAKQQKQKAWNILTQD